MSAENGENKDPYTSSGDAVRAALPDISLGRNSGGRPRRLLLCADGSTNRADSGSAVPESSKCPLELIVESL